MDFGIVLFLFFGIAILTSCIGIGAIIFRHYMMIEQTHVSLFWRRQSLMIKYRDKLHK